MNLSYEPLIIGVVKYLNLGDIIILSKVSKNIIKIYGQLKFDNLLWKNKLLCSDFNYTKTLQINYNINWSWLCCKIFSCHYKHFHVCNLSPESIYKFLNMLIIENKCEYLEVCIKLGYRPYHREYNSNAKNQRSYVTFLNRMCRIVNPRIVEILRYNYYQDYQGMMIHAAQGDNLETLIHVINISHYVNKDIIFDNHKLIRVAIRHNSTNVVKYLLKEYPILNPCARGKRLRNSSIVIVSKYGDQKMIDILMKLPKAADIIEKFRKN
jgi:hypothetical protein